MEQNIDAFVCWNLFYTIRSKYKCGFAANACAITICGLTVAKAVYFLYFILNVVEYASFRFVFFFVTSRYSTTYNRNLVFAAQMWAKKNFYADWTEIGMIAHIKVFVVNRYSSLNCFLIRLRSLITISAESWSITHPTPRFRTNKRRISAKAALHVLLYPSSFISISSK